MRAVIAANARSNSATSVTGTPLHARSAAPGLPALARRPSYRQTASLSIERARRRRVAAAARTSARDPPGLRREPATQAVKGDRPLRPARATATMGGAESTVAPADTDMVAHRAAAQAPVMRGV